jgi:hypothetical protein
MSVQYFITFLDVVAVSFVSTFCFNFITCFTLALPVVGEGNTAHVHSAKGGLKVDSGIHILSHGEHTPVLPSPPTSRTACRFH